MEVVEARIGTRTRVVIEHETTESPNGDRNLSIVLRVDSPWVSGTAYFPACGDDDWRLWLADIGHDYLGEKLFGRATRVPSYQKTVSALRGRINEMRAEGEMTVERANELRREIGNHKFSVGLASDPARIESLLRMVSREEELGMDGVGGYVGFKVNPAYRSFCRHVLEPLSDRLRADYEREHMNSRLEEAVELDETEMEPAETGMSM